MERIKCLIIGSGPAGYTAAIYAARAALHPVQYTGLQIGGQLTTTNEVDNFPGYPAGVGGVQLMEDLKGQAERFGTVLRNDEIVHIDFNDRPFKVTTSAGEQLLSDTIIIATGATAKWLGLPGETKYFGAGVSACATCDGYFYRNKEVVVVGGGDTAIEEATFLSHLASKVYLLVRKDTFRASQIMQDRLENIDNITVLYNTTLTDVLGDNQLVTDARIYNSSRNQEDVLAVQGIFIAIGHTPNTKIFASDLLLDANGYISTIPGTTKTSIPGVFACGDVQDSEYRQAVTAAGSGCMAAIDAERYLSSRVSKNGIFCVEPNVGISTIITRNGMSCITEYAVMNN
ncbi:thioredoxin-disulfide reductase [Chitinophaga nivalis]|uniref:Thioredoxin reductase n=1 Tax=Chitinophaga nivalis TaxID=2991709 RepID=A0ABT3IPP5_9BACT|nr:thioredoxin-disulfide reductase [Chitinophaga nivalis]MCW3464365.1 thioredoxin-disulfide reductase [Chitinophaga nivalis]MCW3485944.1 thioredoxin-disulfide reductase [Chitinophaga nivalis]